MAKSDLTAYRGKRDFTKTSEPAGAPNAGTGSRFVVHEGIDAQRGLLSGIELWGTDLLAFLNGELGPTGLCYAGRLRVWNHRPELLRVSPHDLWRFGHPLRRPEATASLYERLLTAEPRQVPRVPGRRRDPRE